MALFNQLVVSECPIERCAFAWQQRTLRERDDLARPSGGGDRQGVATTHQKAALYNRLSVLMEVADGVGSG